MGSLKDTLLAIAGIIGAISTLVSGIVIAIFVTRYKSYIDAKVAERKLELDNRAASEKMETDREVSIGKLQMEGSQSTTKEMNAHTLAFMTRLEEDGKYLRTRLDQVDKERHEYMERSVELNEQFKVLVKEHEQTKAHVVISDERHARCEEDHRKCLEESAKQTDLGLRQSEEIGKLNNKLLHLKGDVETIQRDSVIRSLPAPSKVDIHASGPVSLVANSGSTTIGIEAELPVAAPETQIPTPQPTTQSTTQSTTQPTPPSGTKFSL